MKKYLKKTGFLVFALIAFPVIVTPWVLARTLWLAAQSFYLEMRVEIGGAIRQLGAIE